jgi:D-glycero-alpha-D-manno-heptose-7-phosphate kinase
MIISRTPLRISFGGGGTDLKGYYENDLGAVTSTAINKYIYVTVNKKFDDKIRVSYSKTEIVDNVEEIQHDLAREAMKLSGVTQGVEVTSIADIPSRGTGLGSSSSFTVGLLNALYAFKGEHASAKVLAEEACRIEIDILKEPIGKQDQYITAFGGIQHIQFHPQGNVFVDPVICKKEVKDKLEKSLLLFYTGITRRADSVLRKQKENLNKKDKLGSLKKMKQLASEIRECLIKGNNLRLIGEYLDQGWLEKKKLAPGISNEIIDEHYRKALEAGAVGGKLLGAGGGGFLLFYCEEENREAVQKALQDLKETPFKFEPQGSKIIYVEE